MKECSKSILRRLYDPNFVRRYLVGNGVDIGGRPDPLSQYGELFPLMGTVRTWDLEDGDAQKMDGVADGAFDFVHSSHCLEHLVDPREALAQWMRILAPGGHMILTVPDEDLYEQGVFPSTFNRDHKWTFTVNKPSSWSDRSLSLLDLLRDLGPAADVRRIEVIDAAYRYGLPRYDQTLTPVAESAIEVVIRKRLPADLAAKGRLPGDQQPATETRIHLNQYRDDQKARRLQNTQAQPFTNEDPL